MPTPTQRFVGRLTDSKTDENAAMQVTLLVTDESLEICIDSGEQWEWDMADVSMNRVAIDRFQLGLAGEDLYFLPVDPMGFVKDVLERYSETPVEPYRGWLRRRIEDAQAKSNDSAGLQIHVEEPVQPTPTDQWDPSPADDQAVAAA